MRERPPVNVTVKAVKGFIWQVYPPRYIVPGQELGLDAVTAREMVSAGRAEYVRVAKPIENRLDPKIDQTQTASMDVSELTNAELRSELESRGVAIPRRANKATLLDLLADTEQ